MDKRIATIDDAINQAGGLVEHLFHLLDSVKEAASEEERQAVIYRACYEGSDSLGKLVELWADLQLSSCPGEDDAAFQAGSPFTLSMRYSRLADVTRELADSCQPQREEIDPEETARVLAMIERLSDDDFTG